MTFRNTMICAICGFIAGFCLCWFGIKAPKPEIVFRDILPSPQVYEEGKRSEPGVLAPETLNAIELESAREIFNTGRDPFGRVR